MLSKEAGSAVPIYIICICIYIYIYITSLSLCLCVSVYMCVCVSVSVFVCMCVPGLGVELVPTKNSQRVRSMSAGPSPYLSNFEQAICLEGILTGGVHL